MPRYQHVSVQLLDPRKPNGGMTPQQTKFCNNVLKGMNYPDAYKSAYNTKGNPNTMNGNIQTLLVNPLIKARLKTVENKIDRRFLDSADALREHTLKGIIKLSNEAEKETTRLRALELLGKTHIVGLFKKEEDESKDKTAKDMTDKQMVDRFRALMDKAAGQAKLIEPDG